MPRRNPPGILSARTGRARRLRNWALLAVPLALTGILLASSVTALEPASSLVADKLPNDDQQRIGRALGMAIPSAGVDAVSIARPMWVGNFESGGFAGFQSTPWNNVPLRPTIVRTPTVDGRYASRFVIPAGGNRCELVPNVRHFSEGDNLWFSWHTMLGTGFQRTSRWQVLDQWKNEGTGSPPLELVVTNGQYRLEGGYGWPGDTSSPRPRWTSRVVGTAHTRVWVKWTMHVKFSSNSRIGYVDLWRNGQPIVKGWHLPGGTMYPHLRSYLKVGYYRDPGIRTQGTVYQDRIKVGSTAGSVA